MIETRTSSTGTPRFDFEAVYARYPKRQGKKQGIAAARKQIKTRADFEALRTAVDRMAAGWSGHELHYCPMWSTFISQARWRDAELPLPRNGAHSRNGVGRAEPAPSEAFAGGEVKP